MANGSNSADPRTDSALVGQKDVRPVVAVPRGGLPVWFLVALGLVAALILFLVLDSRRRTLLDTQRTAASGGTFPSPPPPPLYIPAPPPAPMEIIPPPVVAAPTMPLSEPRPPSPAPAPQYVSPPLPSPVLPPPAPRGDAGPALVLDTTVPTLAAVEVPRSAAEAAAAVAGNTEEQVALLGSRARAGMLANRSTTVPQGTLIPAVLETAFNSTRPGFARAIVSRDVHSFDGSQVLIPRGSRLIGEYRSDTAAGQKRALINWVRLVRPDGVTIDIGSPATDPLGRGGVEASVNTHFFERFAGAILRSVVDIGVTLAARSGNNPVVVALPGTIQGGGAPIGREGERVRPTLKVPPARSISVFLARDLDFSEAGGRR
jgi:type IV secretion system protein VirB10